MILSIQIAWLSVHSPSL